MSQQINLFDPGYGPQRKPFAARTMAVCLLVIALAVAGIQAYFVQQTRSVEQVLRDTQARLADQRERTRAIAVEMGAADGRVLPDEVARLEGRLAARRELLREVTTGVSANAQGHAALMTALSRSARSGLWLTGFTVSEANAIEIRGRAVDAALVPSYMQALNREPVLQGRSVSDLKLVAKSEAAAQGAKAPSGPSRYVEFALELAPRDGGGGAGAPQ